MSLDLRLNILTALAYCIVGGSLSLFAYRGRRFMRRGYEKAILASMGIVFIATGIAYSIALYPATQWISGYLPLLMTLAVGQSAVVCALFTKRLVHWVDKAQHQSDIAGEEGRLEARLASLHEVEAALEAERRACAAKREFMAVMSHELRTPLSAILGYTELLSEEYSGPLNLTQREYIGSTTRAGQHLLGVVQQILDQAATESGKSEKVSPEVVDVTQLVIDCIGFIVPLCERKGLTASVLTPPNGTLTMTTDAQLLRQILINLLTNACKFTERGAIGLAVAQSNGSVAFNVTDSGIGISEANQGKIFDQFWQVSRGPTRTAAGAGLGLTIVKRLVERLGGDIYMKSIDHDLDEHQPRGTTFTVILPTHHPAAELDLCCETGGLLSS